MPADIAEVGAAHFFCRRISIMAQEPDEKFFAVHFRIGVVDHFRRYPLLDVGIAGSEDAAGHRHEMRREVQRYLAFDEMTQSLFDFRRMAVGGNAVCLEVVVELREMSLELGRTACARGARFGIDDDRIRFDEFVLDERSQCQNAGRRIAAGVADDLGIFYLVAVQFSQAVDALSIFMRVLYFVPLFVDARVIKAVVSTEIDDAHRRIFQSLAYFHSMAVRQTDEYEIAVLGDDVEVLHAFELLVVQSAQMRIDFRDSLARMAFRCDMYYFGLRMIVQKT